MASKLINVYFALYQPKFLALACNEQKGNIMETPPKTIERPFGQREFDENIRKAKEEADRPRAEREAKHEAAINRDGTAMMIWFLLAHLLLIAAIIVALVKANYEVALLAGGGLCCAWFYMYARLVDGRLIRGPSADD